MILLCFFCLKSEVYYVVTKVDIFMQQTFLRFSSACFLAV